MNQFARKARIHRKFKSKTILADASQYISQMDSENIAIVSVYIFLFCGALWHVLGLFEEAMQVLASAVIFAVAAGPIYHFIKANLGTGFLQPIWWCGIVVVAGFLFEFIGQKTGLIFGSYNYRAVLQPQLAGVPISIGVAWLNTVLISAAVSQKLRLNKNPLIFALSTGLLMTFFDIFMEPAAVKINYWQWADHTVPVQNYVAWFLIGSGMAWGGIKLGLFKRKVSRLAFHTFWAQLLFFTSIILFK